MSDSKKSIGWGYLPDEILTHIFTFLPIKSIITCTSVSKTWKSLIQNPTFIFTHLHHSHNKIKNNLLLLRLSRNGKEVYTLHKEDDPDFTEYTSFDSPFHAPHLQSPHHNIVGTCNGLLCLSDFLPNIADELFRWNPCVRKLLQFPIRRVAFDTQGKMVWTHVSVYGNSIAGFQRGVKSGQINIWVMKEYGVASSWTKFSHQYPTLGMHHPCPVGFRRNGEVILLNIGGGLVTWNPDSQNIKNLGINGYFDTFFGSYVESLVLLDKANKGVVTY
nr:uncharacterized protein LOC111996579 [Quercus suber]POE70680.1 f-box protein [Quercus suber]